MELRFGKQLISESSTKQNLAKGGTHNLPFFIWIIVSILKEQLKSK
jgi:hypothetical protein